MMCVAPCCCIIACRSADAMYLSIVHSNSTGKHACNAGKDIQADRKQKIQILAILVRMSGLIGTASAVCVFARPTKRMSSIGFANNNSNNSKQALCHMWRI